MKSIIKYENDNFYVVEKYPGFESFEIVDELNKNRNIERNGLIHRLDKDTSGLMIVAKNNQTLLDIQKLFKNREVDKSYLGLVWGKFDKTGKIELNIARDPKRKKPMKIVFYSNQSKRGETRLSKTSWKVKSYYQCNNHILSLVEFKIFTGRTHQIRLTANYLHNPIMGDKIYYFKDSKRIGEKLNIERQFLHSYKLGFKYKNNKYRFISQLPNDLQIILNKLDVAIEK